MPSYSVCVLFVTLSLFFQNSFLYAENSVKNLNSSTEMKLQDNQNKEQQVFPKGHGVEGKNKEISVILINKLWDLRESQEGQQKILEFVQSEPQLPNDYEINWRVSRLVYFAGNFGIGKKLPKDELIKIFTYGYKVGDQAKKLEPKKVEGYYWFAVNFGSYGLAKGILKALQNAPVARDALLEALKIDPSYHWGGLYRILGRYYQELPRIISFGDKEKAGEYYKEAIKIAPNYRLNTVYLGRLLKEEGEKEEALKLFLEAQKMPEVDGKVEEARFLEELAIDIKKLED